MKNINLKPICYLSGKSFSEVHASFLQALKEAISLGVSEDEQKVMSILEAILEIDESDNKNISNNTNNYLKSGLSFDEYMEELVSSSIPQSDRPEPDISEPIEMKKEDDDDSEDDEISDGSYANQVKTDSHNINAIDDDSIENF